MIHSYVNVIVADTEAELPLPSGLSGSKRVAFTVDTGKRFVDVGGEWVEGAAGPQGEIGPAGPAGEDGSDGAQGPQGIQGPAGNTYLAVPFLSGTVTLTNMALADTELPATHYRLKLDLTGFTQYRATMRVATQGSTNSDVRFQGSTNDSVFGNLDGGSGPEVALFGTGEKDSGWQPLSVAYRAADIRIRMMGKDGDGAADPVVRQIVLHFK